MSKRRSVASATDTKNKQRKIQKVSDIRIPAIVFDDGMQFLSPLIQSMLNSTEFKSAICEGLQKMGRGKIFHYSDIPQEVRIVPAADFDKEGRHCLSMYNPNVTAENSNLCIQLSSKMLQSVRNNPNNNHQNLFIGVVIVHEVAHMLISKILHVKQTPNKFKKDNDVKDFGYFVERAMFKALELRQRGLKLFTARPGWFVQNYDDAILG